LIPRRQQYAVDEMLENGHHDEARYGCREPLLDVELGEHNSSYGFVDIVVIALYTYPSYRMVWLASRLKPSARSSGASELAAAGVPLH